MSERLQLPPAPGYTIEYKHTNPKSKKKENVRGTYRILKNGASLAFVLLAALAPYAAQAFSISAALGALVSFGSQVVETHQPLKVHAFSNTPTLKAALNSDPNPAKGGGDITVVGDVALQPEVGPTGTLADIEVAQPGADQISIYVVREGDTLSQIADLFGVTTNTVIWSNDLRGSTIRPGQTLAILPVSGITHTVVKGDTLASIVKKYKGDIDEVLSFNGLSEDATVAIGDSVVVPYGIAPQTTTVSTRAIATGSGGPSISGYFLRPLVGGVKSQSIHGYNAVDLAAGVGTNVLASASGEVIISRSYGYNGGYGQYIVIKHANGTQTLYAHLSQNFVYAGAQVVQGQVIGAVGNTGRSTGPHLHFEVRGAQNPF